MKDDEHFDTFSLCAGIFIVYLVGKVNGNDFNAFTLHLLFIGHILRVLRKQISVEKQHCTRVRIAFL